MLMGLPDVIDNFSEFKGTDKERERWMVTSKFLLATVGKVLGVAKAPITRFYAKYKTKKKAFKGENLFGQGDYYQLVKKELERLSVARDLPTVLQSEQCRHWLIKEENIKLFAKVFLARRAQRADIAKSAEKQLAIDYEQCTEETRKLAPGRVELAINFVYGQLTATDDGIQSLQLACTQFVAGELLVSMQPGPPLVPSDDEIPHLKAMAEAIIKSAEHTWRMPQFVAPLSLELRMPEINDDVLSTDASKLVAGIQSGENIVLHGSGGIGKTTLLLEICKSCLDKGNRIPLYIDVAAWGVKKLGLLEYIASHPASVSNGITLGKLTKFAEAGKLIIMLNGWNETSTLCKLDCGRSLTDIMVTAKALNVVVVSRSNVDVPSVRYSKQVEVRGLSWEGQRKIVLEELEFEKAESLLDLLGSSNRLRRSARSPLILKGLIAQFNIGLTDGHTNEYDLLGASVDAFEKNEQRYQMLSSEPIDNNQKVYLETIACFLTDQQATNCTREDALQAISSASMQLIDRGQISVPPNLSSVLKVLTSHHLLHEDNDIIRFAHQRFQEYFAAGRLLNDCLGTNSSLASLKASMNKTAWDEALELVASKLKRDKRLVNARIKLIRAGKELDLGLACDLVGACSFCKQDDQELHDYLVDRINLLAGSSVDVIRDLGIAYQIASRLPDFADQLWNLLEDDNQQNRLHLYRLNHLEISILQLGEDADIRISRWPSDRRAEFVTETAKNPDNYEYVVKLAECELDQKIRSAAISIFPWEYPASEVPIKSLFDAPIEVLTDHNVISCIQYYSELGDEVEKVLERIKSFCTDEIPIGAQVELTLAFPDEFGAIYQDAVLERLADQEYYMHDDDLQTIAQTYFPERMLDVAKELAFAKKPPSPQDQILRYQPFPPTWVGICLQKMSSDMKHILFQRMLDYLSQGKDINFLNGKIIGPLASSDQIKKCLDFIIHEDGKEYGDVSDKDRMRCKKVEEILINGEGGSLLDVARKFGRESSYDEAALLLKFLNLRIQSDDHEGVIKEWLPTIDDVDALILLFAEKEEMAEDPQNLVRIYLCSIASYVDSHQYMPFIIECCQLHLDIWNVYRERMSKWAKEGMGRRPQNPMYSEDLKSAFARCGEVALPGLLELADHLEAMEFVVGSMVRIVNEPWNSKKERFGQGVISASQEGKERRKQNLVNRQPEKALQPLTDQVSAKLGQKLTKTVTEYLEQKNQKEQFDTRVAEGPVGHLAALLAGIASPEVIEPINHALASGLINIYYTVNVMQGLMRQGLLLDDEDVIKKLEDRYQESKGKAWYSDHERYEMSELIQLLLSVEQIHQLNWPVKFYLEQWRVLSNTQKVLKNIGSINLDAALLILELLAPEMTSTKKNSLTAAIPA
jgi:hypothetical protein